MLAYAQPSTLQPLLPWSIPLPGLDQTLPSEGDSLAVTDAYSAMRAPGFRISIEYIEASIRARHFLNLAEAVTDSGMDPTAAERRTTLCALTMSNGFVVVGKSTPVDPANFDEDKGKRFAYEDAVRQLWPLFAFAYLAVNDASLGTPGALDGHPGPR
jgi:hypothetical protein